MVPESYHPSRGGVFVSTFDCNDLDVSRSLAEEEGFEPPCESPRKRFSRPPVSTTHPFLRGLPYYNYAPPPACRATKTSSLLRNSARLRITSSCSIISCAGILR